MAKSPPTPAQLRKLITVHRGGLSAIAKELTRTGFPVSRQALTVWLRKAGLFELAANERARAGIPGPRTLDDGRANPIAEQDAMAALGDMSGTFTEAAAELGVSRRTLYRRRKRLSARVAPRVPANR